MIPLDEVPRVVKFIEMESRMVVARGGVGGGSWNGPLMDIELPFYKVKRVLKMDDGDGYKTI